MLHAMIVIDPEANYGVKDRAGAQSALSALRAFLRRARGAVPVAGQVSVLLVSDKTIKRLNVKFRGKRHATDVLSFPALEMPSQESPSGKPSRTPAFHPAVAGDLAISLDTAARQAAQFGHPLPIELKILMLHGLLHLAGFDHEADAGEMANREEQLRRRFRLPTTLIARSRGRARQKSAKRGEPARKVAGGKRADR